jgi:hypothetical protein
MPLIHVHFAADPAEPMPLVEELPSIEADDPIAAVEEMLAQGRVAESPAALGAGRGERPRERAASSGRARADCRGRGYPD